MARRQRNEQPVLEARRREVELPAAGPRRLVAVADTHGAPHPRAYERIAELAPFAILHAGDIGDLAVLDGLREIAPLVVVRGNIDMHAPDLPDAIVLDLRQGESVALSLLLFHIAVYGPKLLSGPARLAKSEGAGVVVCGHSHVPFIGVDRGLVVFNPGSIGPKRFSLPIVFGVMELEPTGLRMHHVDCATGQRWSP